MEHVLHLVTCRRLKPHMASIQMHHTMPATKPSRKLPYTPHIRRSLWWQVTVHSCLLFVAATLITRLRLLHVLCLHSYLAFVLRQLRAQVPQPQRRVPGATGQPFAVRAELHCQHRLSMTCKSNRRNRDNATIG